MYFGILKSLITKGHVTAPALHLFLISDTETQHRQPHCSVSLCLSRSGREPHTYLPDPGGNITVRELVSLLDSVCAAEFCFVIYRHLVRENVLKQYPQKF